MGKLARLARSEAGGQNETCSDRGGISISLLQRVRAVRRFPVLVLVLSTTGLYSFLMSMDACEKRWDGPQVVLRCS